MSEQVASSKKITLGLILSWIFGSLFALIGIISLFSDPIPAIIMFIMAAVLLPPVTKWVDQRWKFHLSKGVKITIIIIGIIIFGAAVDTSDISNLQQVEKQEEEQLTDGENVNDEPATSNQADEETLQIEADDQLDIEAEAISISDGEEVESLEEIQATPILTESVSQKNAIRSAEDYLNYSAFSYDGLVEQLEYEQFSHEDAVYGVENSGADWYEQAAESAKQYMDYSAFSRGSLIDQLKYEGFTQAQAEHGADAVGL